MRPQAKAYVGVVAAAGLAGFALSVYRYASAFPVDAVSLEVQQMVCLTVLCALCRSLPIYIGDGKQALDVSVVSVLAAVIAKGPHAAVVVYVLSSLFAFDHDKATHKTHTLWNTSPVKTLFNNANLTLAILLPGMLFARSGGISGVSALPDVLLPSLLFSVGTFLINGSLLFGLFIADGKATFGDALHLFRSLLPNVLFAMPLGILISLLFIMPSGHYLTLLMLFPLLLARYAWSLYLDAQVQHMRLINAFVSAMEAKDKYTEGHSHRVEGYAVQIAREMRLRAADIREIRVAALLHDIGKIGIEDGILRKPDKLTPEEFARIEEHPAIGVEIVQKVGLSGDVTDMIRHHHERYDGQGYPDRMRPENLSISPYILGVADAFDAMTSTRPYRASLSMDRAIAIVRAESGKQFHPLVVRAFLTLAERGDIKP